MGKAAKIKERRIPRGKAAVETVVEDDGEGIWTSRSSKKSTWSTGWVETDAVVDIGTDDTEVDDTVQEDPDEYKGGRSVSEEDL